MVFVDAHLGSIRRQGRDAFHQALCIEFLIKTRLIGKRSTRMKLNDCGTKQEVKRVLHQSCQDQIPLQRLYTVST